MTLLLKDHSAGAEIVLSFSENVDLSGVDGGACSGLNSGTFTCNDLTFDVGTGSFTFDAVTVDNTAKTISFNVNLGNPMIANSAFRTSIADMSIAGSSNLDYSSNLGGAEIETGSAVIATEASQYSFAVQTEYNNRVERVNQETFATFAADESDLKDVARVNILDKASEFDVAAFTVDSDIKVSADLHLGEADQTAFAITGTTATNPAAVIVDSKLAGFTSTLTALDANKSTVITFTNGSGEKIALTSFAIDADVEYGNLATSPTTTGSKTLAQAADLGQWELDASVVNVPLPTSRLRESFFKR